MSQRVFLSAAAAMGLMLAQSCRTSDEDSGRLPYVIPDPQSMVVAGDPVLIPERPGSVAFVLPDRPSPKLQLAARLVRERLAELSGTDGLASTGQSANTAEDAALTIRFQVWRDDQVALSDAVNLDSEDISVLRDAAETEQSYVIRIAERDAFLVGSTDQGALYAAATLIQLLESRSGRLELARVHIRDFPDIKYREAADWLQNVEGNRWGYDYGDGEANFIRRIKRKLDFCLKYKINAVTFDGFGWTLEPEYAALMRSINRYARERGIHLFFGGYGAGYGLGTYQGFFNTPAYRGKLFYNRRSYPDGEIYSCIGMAHENERFPPRTLGTCRSNEELNRLKQEELAAFVRAVEPGALYIHHEDLSNYPDTQVEWEVRDEGCRKRWPNDDLKAVDGGAGALAHGYNTLLDAIYSVKNEESGYDASRDCIVVLISPSYMAFGVGKTPRHHDSIEAARQDWNNVQELWVNIFKQLKHQGPRVQGGFREMFPFQGPEDTWPLRLHEKLREQDLNFGSYVFVVEGANYYNSDSTFMAAPVGNASFAGATTLYNFSGTFAQEPQQLLNAEYAWNLKARDFFLRPTIQIETERRLREYQMNLVEPEEIFSESGFLGEACRKLYGDEAGRYMYQYFRRSREQREFASPGYYQEGHGRWTLSKIYPMNTMFYNLANAQRTWEKNLADTQIGKTLADFARNVGGDPDISTQDLHRKLERIWRLRAEVTREATADVANALQVAELPAGNKEDLIHLSKRLELGYRFSAAVAALYRVYQFHHEADTDAVTKARDESKRLVADVESFKDENFTFAMTDPSGGDQSSWQFYIDVMRDKLGEMSP